MNNFTKTALLLLATFTIFSCQKDPAPLPVPQITEFGVTAADTTITVGSKIEFAPKITTIQDNEYSWELAGTKVATTQDYTFNTTETGKYNLKYSVKNESGVDSREVTIIVKKYIGGFFIVNEGWAGHDQGSVNYFDTKTSTLTPTVYQANNEGMTLGKTTAFGAQWGDNYYFISKQGRRIVAADALSFKDKGSLEMLGADGRAFAGVSSSTAVVTTSSGAYRLSLNPLSMGAILAGTEKSQCGGVYATEDHVFVINQNKGLQIFSVKEDYKLVKTEPNVSVGLTRAKDGSIWAAATTSLVKVDPKTLEITKVVLPDGIKINNSWGAWNCGSLCASKTENAIFFTKGGAWGGGREIYRYEIGKIESLATVFASSKEADDAFYGSGISIDPLSGDIVATFVKDGWGESYQDNRLVIFDAKTGIEKSRTKFTYYWFPSMIIFN